MAIGNLDRGEDPRLSKIEALTRETFTLWNEKRVGFSWRSYYMDHTLRVRSNALSIGAVEGADHEVLAYAATLHDITKRYDGPYKVDQSGNRVVNEDGLWVNEPLRPARQNVVTRMYDEMNLYFHVHHDSGAKVAEKLLQIEGCSNDFTRQVSHVIRGHLRPLNPPWRLGSAEDPYGDPESCVLYDADTIDANLGAVAFYRHIQIHGHRVIQEKGELDLLAYVDAIGNWVERKEEFVDKCLTKTGKAVAAYRYETDRRIHRWLEKERQTLRDFRVSKEFGVMGLIRFFLQNVDDPNMHRELDEVERQWVVERRQRIEAGDAPAGADEALARAEKVVQLMRAEVEGRLEEL